jgi:hypothetical protein
MRTGLSSFLDPFLEDDRWSLLRFVLVASYFRYTNDYIMASNMFLLTLESIKG